MYNLYRCCNCGQLFHEDDIKYVEEPRGEFWGQPCTERMSYSPCCEADIEEYESESWLWECEDCGKIWSEDDVDAHKVRGFGTEWEIERRCPDCLGDVRPYYEE